ncbi:molybdopterin-guanine dinucleotide biosynthesis protein B [Thalassobacillus cyri]|uniref:Molybdopterin-guanine dinucleotide biosynthesis protein B n=1 Tax=Thalassobacillus cyri TaxID=571932 RepID=A0A1H3VI73_9BACI|nr:molybdopterin-guanine dinucleotide biosynthesis protein B [Thalassobacillus cyri]SDZ74503.1 molybdopterin-guanine dinucleotide biosynthesis protein B [Thalassobacillus cyri]
MPKASSFPIIQVIGYKNSGKTTMVNRLIRYASDHNIKTASLKHHGHQDSLTPIHAGTDSYTHKESGAFITGVEGGGSLQLEFGEDIDVSLDQLIKIYESFSPGLLVVEGYKQEVHPKIVMIRKEADLELITTVSNIKAIIRWNAQLENPSEDIPVFELEHIDDHLAELIYLCKEV